MNMVRIMGLAAALAAGLAMASPAAAQMTGSRLGKNADAKEAQGVLDVMVRCVGARKPAYATRVMQTMPGSEFERKTIFANVGDLSVCMDDRSRRLIIGDNVEMRMSARSFRLAVMAKESLRGIDIAALSAAPEWNTALYTGDPGDEPKRDTMQLGLYQFGDCVVAAKPAEAVTLLTSGPESVAGKAAVQAMVPTLGPCLSQGAQMTLTEATLAMAVAEPLYFRARAIKQGKAAN